MSKLKEDSKLYAPMHRIRTVDELNNFFDNILCDQLYIKDNVIWDKKQITELFLQGQKLGENFIIANYDNHKHWFTLSRRILNYPHLLRYLPFNPKYKNKLYKGLHNTSLPELRIGQQITRKVFASDYEYLIVFGLLKEFNIGLNDNVRYVKAFNGSKFLIEEWNNTAGYYMQLATKVADDIKKFSNERVVDVFKVHHAKREQLKIGYLGSDTTPITDICVVFVSGNTLTISMKIINKGYQLCSGGYGDSASMFESFRYRFPEQYQKYIDVLTDIKNYPVFRNYIDATDFRVTASQLDIDLYNECKAKLNEASHYIFQNADTCVLKQFIKEEAVQRLCKFPRDSIFIPKYVLCLDLNIDDTRILTVDDYVDSFTDIRKLEFKAEFKTAGRPQIVLRCNIPK